MRESYDNADSSGRPHFASLLEAVHHFSRASHTNQCVCRRVYVGSDELWRQAVAGATEQRGDRRG